MEGLYTDDDINEARVSLLSKVCILYIGLSEIVLQYLQCVFGNNVSFISIQDSKFSLCKVFWLTDIIRS